MSARESSSSRSLSSNLLPDVDNTAISETIHSPIIRGVKVFETRLTLDRDQLSEKKPYGRSQSLFRVPLRRLQEEHQYNSSNFSRQSIKLSSHIPPKQVGSIDLNSSSNSSFESESISSNNDNPVRRGKDLKQILQKEGQIVTRNLESGEVHPVEHLEEEKSRISKFPTFKAYQEDSFIKLPEPTDMSKLRSLSFFSFQNRESQVQLGKVVLVKRSFSDEIAP